jgi:hypothetical protein
LTSLRHRLSGSGHPQTLNTERLAPRCLLSLGRTEKAEQQQRSVLDRTEKALGLDDEFVLEDKVTLAEILLEAGKIREAGNLNAEVLGIYDSKGREWGDLVTWLRNETILARIDIVNGTAEEASEKLGKAIESC